MTDAERDALQWFKEHGSDGCFTLRSGFNTVLAGGEYSHHMRATWNNLQAQGYVEFYGLKDHRLRVK
jgi:hypothetical protein